MALNTKLLLIVLDGVPWRNWRQPHGQSRRLGAVGRCARLEDALGAALDLGLLLRLDPHRRAAAGAWHPLERNRFRVEQPDIFSEVPKAGGKTGAVTHSYWSEFFNRYPFDLVRDIEYDEPGGPITHGRFHTMTGYNHDNQMTPSDVDLFATLTMLTERHGIDYGILHTCTLDSMGHRFGHDCVEMDHACLPWTACWRPSCRNG